MFEGKLYHSEYFLVVFACFAANAKNMVFGYLQSAENPLQYCGGLSIAVWFIVPESHCLRSLGGFSTGKKSAAADDTKYKHIYPPPQLVVEFTTAVVYYSLALPILAQQPTK